MLKSRLQLALVLVLLLGCSGEVPETEKDSVDLPGIEVAEPPVGEWKTESENEESEVEREEEEPESVDDGEPEPEDDVELPVEEKEKRGPDKKPKPEVPKKKTKKPAPVKREKPKKKEPIVPPPVEPVIPAPPKPGAPTLNVSASIKQLHFSWSSIKGATAYRFFENEKIIQDSAARSLANEIAVHLFDWENTRYRVEACNSSGCESSSSFSVALLRSQTIGRFEGLDDGDYFGWSVAVSGDGKTMAVGAHSEDGSSGGINGDRFNNDLQSSGAVYLYMQDQKGFWGDDPVYLKAPTPEASAMFGYSVALSDDGRRLAIGAFGENGIYPGAGAAYVYQRGPTGSWDPDPVHVKASSPGSSDHFGSAISLSGDGETLAIGARDQNGGARNSGAVYVYRHQGGEWAPDAPPLKGSNSRESDVFGSALSLNQDGTVLAVGAPGRRNSEGEPAGMAYMFVSTEEGWGEEARFSDEDGTTDRFGSSVDLSGDGNRVVVAQKAGQFGIYSRSEAGWMNVVGSWLFSVDGVSISQDGKIIAGVGNNRVSLFEPSLDGWALTSRFEAEVGDALCVSEDGQTLGLSVLGEQARGKVLLY